MAKNNGWRGLLLGVAGSVGGLLAMRAYWKYLAPEVKSRLGEDRHTGDKSEVEDTDVSLIGKQYEEGETSTAALGKMVYKQIQGREPRAKESKEMLSYLVHWGYGLVQGGIYGWILKRGGPITGMLYSTGLWLIGDEIIVPMLGLQPGPASFSLADHVNRLGAHWSYGLGTGITTKVLDEIL